VIDRRSRWLGGLLKHISQQVDEGDEHKQAISSIHERRITETRSQVPITGDDEGPCPSSRPDIE